MYKRLNPWANTMLSQVLIGRLVVDATIKTCNPQNRVNVDALPDAQMPRSEPRLNPLEFHGRRNSGIAPQRSNKAHVSGVHGSNRDNTRRTEHES